MILENIKNKLSHMNKALDEALKNAEVFVPDEVEKARYGICLSCPQFHTTTKICKICHCYLPVKTKLANTGCPQQKWHKYDIE